MASIDQSKFFGLLSPNAQIVAGDNQGDLSTFKEWMTLAQITEEIEPPPDFTAIETAHWLVKKKHFWSQHQSSRQSRPDAKISVNAARQPVAKRG